MRKEYFFYPTLKTMKKLKVDLPRLATDFEKWLEKHPFTYNNSGLINDEYFDPNKEWSVEKNGDDHVLLDIPKKFEDKDSVYWLLYYIRNSDDYFPAKIHMDEFVFDYNICNHGDKISDENTVDGQEYFMVFEKKQLFNGVKLTKLGEYLKKKKVMLSVGSVDCCNLDIEQEGTLAEIETLRKKEKRKREKGKSKTKRIS